ncbi:MAG: hypothetical protein MJZ49_05010, partial [Bacteroidales bacterium]|nr:hypothetical protein [Bacteroidales bacterium]
GKEFLRVAEKIPSRVGEGGCFNYEKRQILNVTKKVSVEFVVWCWFTDKEKGLTKFFVSP